MGFGEHGFYSGETHKRGINESERNKNASPTSSGMAVNSRAIPSLSKSGSFAGLHLTIIDDIAGLPPLFRARESHS
ncbi:hypothetical protein K443DRAFT_678413, partial [Laccaria amethystina LaAM-08-1]